MKRIARGVGALVAALTLVGAAGCGSSGGGSSSGSAASEDWSIPTKDPKATVKVVSILSLKAPNNMQKVVDAFEKDHPSITVDWETVPFDNLNTVLDARITNKGGDPDVYWADMPRIPALAARGYTADLTKQFSKYKSAFDDASYQGGSYDGKLWGLPIANSTQLLYYNKDLLAKAGLQPPSVDPQNRTTWEQLTQDAAAAHAAGAPYGLTFGQPDRYYQLQPLPMSLGGSAGGKGKGNLTPDVNTQPWVKAMTWYGSIFASGVSPRGVPAEQSDPDFLAGKTAYMVEGPWLLQQLQDSKVNWGVAVQPQFQGGKAVTPTGSWALGMNPFSKNKEAAAIFMKWMAVDNGSGYIKYASSPELAANTKGKEIYFATPLFSSEEGQKAKSIIDYETSHTAVNRLSTVGYVEFEDIMGRTFSDIRNGADPQKALDQAQEQLTTAWSKYQK